MISSSVGLRSRIERGNEVARRAMAGFTLVELIIALGVSAFIGLLAAGKMARDSEEVLAEGAAVYIQQVASAAQQHVLLNWNSYAGGTPVTGVATALRPTVPELVALGRLNAGFPSGAGSVPTRQSLRIDITRSAGCPGATCQVLALVCTTTPVTLGGPRTRFDLSSLMATKQGGTGGQSLPGAGTIIRGPTLNVTNPVGNAEGIVCGSGSVDTALFERFLVVADTRDPNFQGPFTVAGASQLKGGVTVTGNSSVSGNSAVGGTQSIVGRLATSGLNPNDLPAGYIGGVRTRDVVAGGTVVVSDNVPAFTGSNTNYSLMTQGEIRTSGRTVADRILPTGKYEVGTVCAAADEGAIARALRDPTSATQDVEGLVTCRTQRWRPLIAYAAAGGACSPNGAMADTGVGAKLLCVGSKWLPMTALRPLGTPGAACTSQGASAYDEANGSELLICRLNPAGGAARWMRLRDLTSNLSFVNALEVGDGTQIVKPICAAAAGMSATPLLQLVSKAFATSDGGVVLFAQEASSGTRWVVRLKNGAGNPLSGNPGARAIANVFCYFS